MMSMDEFIAEKAKQRGVTVEEFLKIDARESAERRAAEEERERRRWLRAFHESVPKSGIPLRTIEAATNPIDSPAMREIWGDFDLLVLAGKPGVGKSVAACVWMMSNNPELYMLNDISRWIQAGEIARGFAYDADAFRDITRIKSLVIDDLGIEYLDNKDRYLSTLEEILSARYANKRPTLMTTNCTPAEFRERYGERLVSRIHEDGAFIVCGGEDLRRRGKNAEAGPENV